MQNPALDFIKQARRSQLMSMRRLAKMAYMSPAYMSQIENGKRPLTMRATARIADALGMPPYDLLAMAGFIPMDDLDEAKEMADMALTYTPELIPALAGKTEAERRFWMVNDWLYLLGHDADGTGYDAGPGGHAFDWRVFDPELMAPMLERARPELDAWVAEQKRRDTITSHEWAQLTPAQRSIIRELIDNFLACSDGPGKNI